MMHMQHGKTVGLCVAAISTILLLSCKDQEDGGGGMFGGGNITMEAYWNEKDHLVFERSSARPNIATIAILKNNTILWNVINGYQPFISVAYGVVPAYLGGERRPRQSIPEDGSAPPELKQGDVVEIDLGFRQTVGLVATMGGETWRIVVPPKGERSRGTRTRKFRP